MATATHPEVSVELGGKTRFLHFDLNTFCTAEEELGISMADQDTWTTIRMSTVRGLIYAALKADDPAITVQDVGSWISPTNLSDVVAKFKEALTVAIPEPKEEEPADVPLEASPPSG